MSDEGDDPRRDADEEGDAFDSLDDLTAETDDSDAIDDPFAELGAGVDSDEFEESAPADADPTDFDTGSDDSDPVDSDPVDSDPTDPDPTDPDVDDLGSTQSSVGGAPDARRDDPFDEIGPADSGTDLDDAFEEMDVGGPAEEDVWESLDADAAGTGAVGRATSAPGQGDAEHVVSKRTYCQQCPHFTSPPDVACTHEGTSILEAVGFDEFRVRNCPMISEEDPTFDADG